MVCSKIKKILFVLLCLFVVLFPFWCVRGLCAEEWEVVDYDHINGIRITTSSNIFTEGSNIGVGYIPIEFDYIYKIVNNGTAPYQVAESNEIPALNGLYNLLYTIPIGEEYIYRGTSGYLYLDFRSNTSGNIPTVYKCKLTSMDGAVGELVDKVGIQSLWNTFNDANPFILVVVLFSFGLFIIVVLVRKLRKGKGGF